jgi:hypothetical protein
MSSKEEKKGVGDRRNASLINASCLWSTRSISMKSEHRVSRRSKNMGGTVCWKKNRVNQQCALLQRGFYDMTMKALSIW